MHGAVTLRLASRDDIACLAAWDEDPVVRACSGEADMGDWADELAMPWQEVLIGEEDGRPVGVVVVLDPAAEPDRYWGEIDETVRAIDIWIGHADDRSRGIGQILMQAAAARCFADPQVTAILIDPLESNIAARRFYARLGYVDLGGRRFGADLCRVMRLDRP